MLRKIYLLLFILLLFNNQIVASARVVQGQVIDMHSKKGIPGVEIILGDEGTISDLSGYFQLVSTSMDTLTIRCMGYETLQIRPDKLGDIIVLKSRILEGQSIHVAANRVIPGITPVAYSSLVPEDIKSRYTVEDVPMILSSEAGVHAYSESGNGTGYSYVSIRGFDQSRIAVMLDNVPLNDNESHQVYWVDHGDILSSAEEVEIQRGVGSSLYGASAFGGSINIHTGIKSDHEELNIGVLKGSYNTEKYRLAYKSGSRLGENLSLSLRGSLLNSDGYRVDSRSEQASVSLAVEHRDEGMTNQFRGIIGKEFSVLQWDGVSKEFLDDTELRRQKMSWTVPFTDDFLQQIYSLNTRILINKHSTVRNVVYLVKGSGYYQVQKYGQDAFSYNLDINNQFPDSVEQVLTTDLQRRKWITNNYYGITPIWTQEGRKWRSDIGLELRKYTGNHYGEVFNLSDSSLASTLPKNFQYYTYTGQKSLATVFSHFLFRITPTFTTSLDLRAQYINWELNQADIGHAPGVDLSAKWQFFNPRFGLRYAFSDGLSVFAGIGTASKEPADAQIIEADNVWSQPRSAETEKVIDTELGMNYYFGRSQININFYRIEYQNELLSDIYDFQDGGFTLESAGLTLHQGLEFDLKTRISNSLDIALNGSIAEHRFTVEGEKGNALPNVPNVLANAHLNYRYEETFETAFSVKYVGKQFIDNANTQDYSIPAYVLTDIYCQYQFSDLSFTLKLNNALDIHYATFGYEYYGGYYWPGATRNYSLGINYSF